MTTRFVSVCVGPFVCARNTDTEDRSRTATVTSWRFFFMNDLNPLPRGRRNRIVWIQKLLPLAAPRSQDLNRRRPGRSQNTPQMPSADGKMPPKHPSTFCPKRKKARRNGEKEGQKPE